MDDLIAKLEAATEGSRELDAEVAMEIHPRLKTYTPDTVTGPGHWISDKDGRVYAQDYTTSLDAAVTLIPEGWRLDELKNLIDYWGCILWYADPPQAVYCGYNDQLRPKSSILAICIAALKARSQTDAGDS